MQERKARFFKNKYKDSKHGCVSKMVKYLLIRRKFCKIEGNKQTMYAILDQYGLIYIDGQQLSTDPKTVTEPI